MGCSPNTSRSTCPSSTRRELHWTSALTAVCQGAFQMRVALVQYADIRLSFWTSPCTLLFTQQCILLTKAVVRV